MAAKRAERATGMAAEQEQEQEQERKRIFDFIDSFRYTGSGSGSRSRVSSRASNGNKAFSFVIHERDTDTDMGPETKPPPPLAPPSPPSPPVNVIVKKRRRKGTSVSAVPVAVAVAPAPVGAASSKARNRHKLPKDESQVIGPDTPIATIATVAVERRKTKPKSKSNSNSKPKPRRSSLAAAEKVMEAYRRVPPGFNFMPPRSSHCLLQEDHAFDPWRVLIICMLLNNTTGAQVKKVVDDLFALCPDAETTIQVDVELIEHVIRSLGLQNKRAKMIKILSQQYLDPYWTYVTSLHGVGKYAADAYAIFCTGKGADVRPDDHKLVDYWNSIYGNGSGVISQYAGEPLTKSAAPNAGNKSCNKRKKGFRESGSEKETAGTTDKSDKFNNGVTNVRDGTVSHFYLHGLIRDMIHKHQCATWLSTADNVVAHIGESKANDLDTKVKMLRIDEIKLRAMESSLMAELLGIVANEMADR